MIENSFVIDGTILAFSDQRVRINYRTLKNNQASDEIVTFHISRVEGVTAVQNLNDIADRISDSHVVMETQILETLDQSSLHVSGLGCLDRCVDETLAASHRVKEKLGRRESRVK